MARECKRARSTAGGAGSRAPARDRFVRARRANDNITPAGSQASGSTPADSQPGGRPQSPSVDDRDPLPPGHPEERPWETACIIQRTPAIDGAEAGLRFALMALVADASRTFSVAEASSALRDVRGVQEGTFAVKPFYPEHFLVECHSGKTRDRILRASPVPINGTYLTLLPWTRLVHADAATMTFKVSIELEGIPPHAWAQDTAAKILAPSYWIHTVDAQTESKAYLSAFRLSAWASDPRAIPKVVWLHIAENEVVHVSANPIFGNLPPYIRRKNVLGYRVLVHLRNVTDFDPENPTPPSSSPESDDGDSGHDGNPERHHFSGGAVHCIHGFRCNRGIVDGEPAPNPASGTGCRWAERVIHQAHLTTAISEDRAAVCDANNAAPCRDSRGATSDDSVALLRSEPAAGAQPVSDPMVLEAGLHSMPAASVPKFTNSHRNIQPERTSGVAAVCAAELASPASLDEQPAGGAAVCAADLTSTAPPDGHSSGVATVCAAELASPAPIAPHPLASPIGVDEHVVLTTGSVDVSSVRNTAQGPDAGIKETPLPSAPDAGAPPAENPVMSGALAWAAGTPDRPTATFEAPEMARTTPTHTPAKDSAAARAPAADVSPPGEPTPTPQEAARRLAKFKQDVQVKRQTPLIGAPPKPKQPTKRNAVPMRSRRIAAQQLDHIPASKRGEVLKKRMGSAQATARPASASTKPYDAVFGADLNAEDVAAFEALFPATRNRGTRALRRTVGTVA